MKKQIERFSTKIYKSTVSSLKIDTPCPTPYRILHSVQEYGGRAHGIHVADRRSLSELVRCLGQSADQRLIVALLELVRVLQREIATLATVENQNSDISTRNNAWEAVSSFAVSLSYRINQKH